jgi:hypothetical protein
MVLWSVTDVRMVPNRVFHDVPVLLEPSNENNLGMSE